LNFAVESLLLAGGLFLAMLARPVLDA